MKSDSYPSDLAELNQAIAHAEGGVLNLAIPQVAEAMRLRRAVLASLPASVRWELLTSEMHLIEVTVLSRALLKEAVEQACMIDDAQVDRDAAPDGPTVQDCADRYSEEADAAFASVDPHISSKKGDLEC